MEKQNTKKSLSEQRYEMMAEYDKKHAAFRKRLGLPEKMQDEECMTELLVDAGEMTWEDMDVMKVYARMVESKSLKKALKNNPANKYEYKIKITADQFKENVVRVMQFNSWEEFVGQWGNCLDA